MNKFLVKYCRRIPWTLKKDLLEQVEITKEHVEYIKKLHKKIVLFSVDYFQIIMQ